MNIAARAYVLVFGMYATAGISRDVYYCRNRRAAYIAKAATQAPPAMPVV
jgi:hypothetical protein